MSIKVRLLELNKRQTDLLEELRKRGYKTLQPPELSLFINKKLTTPKAREVLSLCEEILSEWESETKQTKVIESE